MSPQDKEIMERAFSSGVCGCRRRCDCGAVFYDAYNDGIDWDEGEFEALEADPEAKSLGHSVGTVILGGREYVMDCNCWEAKGEQVLAWILENQNQLREFFRLRKEAIMAEVAGMPEIPKL